MSDKFLDELLEGPEINSSYIEEEDKKLSPIICEINLIKDDAIRSFVRSMLCHAETFWNMPSTSEGFLHPPDESGSNGNVLHTQRVVRIVYMMCHAQEVTETERDLLLAAALLHDITKGIGRDDGTIFFDHMHPYTVDFFASIVLDQDEKQTDVSLRSTSLYVSNEILGQILRLIRCHMGKWSPVPETYPITGLEWILHLADAIAAQVHIVIDGEDIQEWRWNEPKRRKRAKTPEESSPPSDNGLNP